MGTVSFANKVASSRGTGTRFALSWPRSGPRTVAGQVRLQAPQREIPFPRAASSKSFVAVPQEWIAVFHRTCCPCEPRRSSAETTISRSRFVTCVMSFGPRCGEIHLRQRPRSSAVDEMNASRAPFQRGKVLVLAQVSPAGPFSRHRAELRCSFGEGRGHPDGGCSHGARRLRVALAGGWVRLQPRHLHRPACGVRPLPHRQERLPHLRALVPDCRTCPRSSHQSTSPAAARRRTSASTSILKSPDGVQVRLTDGSPLDVHRVPQRLERGSTGTTLNFAASVLRYRAPPRPASAYLVLVRS